VEVAGASIMLGISLLRLELDIQKTTSAFGPDANVAQLQLLERSTTFYSRKHLNLMRVIRS
jgi:hypothetical protein